MRYVVPIAFLFMMGCGLSREERASLYASDMLATLQSGGQCRMMAPQERKAVQDWMATQLLDWEK